VTTSSAAKPHLEDIDIWRTDTYLIKNRDHAEMYAALRADELLAAGYTDGNRVWIRIGLAIRNLQARKAAEG
jgi:hypothetical protein